MGCDSNPHGMGSDPVTSSESATEGPEVMASIDAGEEPRLVIADITAEEAWMSIPAKTSASLTNWR